MAGAMSSADFPASARFVRASVFSATAIPSKTAGEAVFQLFQILDNFDIPVVVAREARDGALNTD